MTAWTNRGEGMPGRLTGHLPDQLARTTEKLLTPLDYATLAAWREVVRASVRALIRVERVALRLPLPGLEPDPQDELSPAVERAFQRVAGGSGQAVVELHSPAVLMLAVPSAAGPHGHAGLFCYHGEPGGRSGRQRVALLRLVQPAFKAGVATCLALAQRRTLLHALLGGLAEGAAILDGDGRVLHRNGALAQLLAADAEPRQVLAAAAGLAHQLYAEGRKRGPSAPTSASAEASTLSGRYRLFASMLAAGSFGHTPTLLVIVEPRNQRLPPPITLRRRFGLSRREAEVALLLAQGRRNDHIAAGLAISPHTARHHTEMVLAKLGTRSRAEVGPLLLRV